ncbi:Yqey-like protein-domain-containing protein [Xylaria bambusicola]|uniref:Yqey-like protein-domain-containing protein n=1 Tax=Xylaria bambusicola TaxID=326684 RepID=UPI002008A8CA|nr:Yqey-like protein-domain-containing protein [Xylaria bambusicola]KAI0525922.1 Yqey-like protein-domain-containing protein [Xylaria bambusicola]
MSLRPSTRIATGLLRPQASRLPSRIPSLASFRSYSDAPAPPLLQKLKADLKTAMRAKDAARLSVLRAALSSTLNASKTSSPITTDAALVGLLRKQARGCADARDEFAAAGRDDLVAKEEAQIAVLNEYMADSGVEELSSDQLRVVVRDVVAGLGDEKAKMGDIMKTLLAPGGPLDGKDVEKAELARVVKEVVSA